MRQQLSAYINNASTTIILVVAVLLPLLFAPLTTEYYEMPKLIFLVGTSTLLLLLWSLSWVVQGKVTLTRTPIDLPLLFLLVVVILSAFFSVSRYPAIFGSFPRVHGSAIAWIAYIVFYFIAVSHLRRIGQVKAMLYALFLSGVLVSVLSVLSYFGIFLPIPFAKFVNFSPTGSSFATAALATLLLPLPLVSLLNPNKYLPREIGIVLASVFAVTIILLGNLTIYLTAIIIVALTIFVTKRDSIQKNLPFLLIPIGVSLVLLILSYIPLGKANPLQQKMANFPREIQLDFPTSWKVAVSAFRDSPFLGSGPGTYLFDFTVYKPAEFNLSNYWNIRFDTGFNEFLQSLATTGVLGFLSLVFLVGLVLSFSLKSLASQSLTDQSPSENEWHNPLTVSLAISSVAAIILLTLHASTLVTIVITLLILAMLMAAHKSVSGKVQELSLGIKASSIADSGLIIGDALPIILFIPIVIFVMYVLWNGLTVVQADYHHRVALNAANTRGIDTYNNLVRAEQLNPRIDLYRVDLAQTNFALANNIALQKGPTQASPGGSLTDQDRQTIQQLLSQAINEGRSAVALSPQNPGNWEILASIYRQISGVAQNALSFALEGYGRAIQKDPMNPLLRLNVGGIYYSIRNYDLAIRFFTDAVNLKPDYANAYYNLSVALRDKGDLQSAKATAEQVVAILQKDTKNPDYKTASDYLADLNARIATSSGQQAQAGGQVPPAAQQNGALQNKNLPNVLDLPKPENVATPAAVKRNPKASALPSASPSPEGQ